MKRCKNFSYSPYRKEDEVFEQFAFNHIPNLLRFVNAGTASIYGDEIEAVLEFMYLVLIGLTGKVRRLASATWLTFFNPKLQPYVVAEYRSKLQQLIESLYGFRK